MTDNEQVVNFVCGSIIPKEIYEKAKRSVKNNKLLYMN